LVKPSDGKRYWNIWPSDQQDKVIPLTKAA
jgi:hypothetical protein